MKEELEQLKKENFIYVPNNYTFILQMSYILHKHGLKLLLPSNGNGNFKRIPLDSGIADGK